MTAPMLIGRSNLPADTADKAVHVFGFGRDPQAPYLQTPGDVRAYEYAHVVLGFRRAVPKALATHPDLRTHTSDGVTWVGGTIAAFATAIDSAAVPLRSEIAARLARDATNFPVFGNPRFLPEPPADITLATAKDAATIPVWGGIVAAAVDPDTAARLVAAGARVLWRAGDSPEAAPWRNGNGRRGKARAGAVPIVLSVDLEELDSKARKLVDEFLAAYHRMHGELADHPVAADLRLPCEGTDHLFVLDFGVLDAAAADAPPRTRATLARLQQLLTTAVNT
ncbi:MAG: hypothetical protein H3C62_09470 [Gemmatimonadaceae bacterium]|nr:hypothetical protein [Gemmatimonadaceae bacterium]